MRRLILGLALVALAGCSSPKMQNTGQVAIVEPSQLPPPTRPDLIQAGRPHFIGPFDKVSVEVFGVPDLSRTVQVDASGDIELPAIGSVVAGGKTPGELTALLIDSYRANYVRDPKVTVSIVETVSQTVAVDGDVKLPGIYPVAGNLSLMRALARAQGITDVADVRHVVVFRKVNNQSMAALYDLQAIRLGAYQDPQIYPNDVIVVGESQARRLFPQILQGASLLVTPLITILR